MKTFGKVYEDAPKKVVEIVEVESVEEKSIEEIEFAEKSHSELTKDEIMAQLKERGIEFAVRSSKAELIALLEA